MFQAEVAAKHLSARKKTALKALDYAQVNSNLVCDCVYALSELRNYCSVALAWIPGHAEKPMVAQKCVTITLMGLQPLYGIAK